MRRPRQGLALIVAAVILFMSFAPAAAEVPRTGPVRAAMQHSELGELAPAAPLSVQALVRRTQAAITRARTYRYQVFNLNNGRTLVGGGMVNLAQGSMYLGQNGDPEIYVIGATVYERTGGQWSMPDAPDPGDAARDGLSRFLTQEATGWTLRGHEALSGQPTDLIERVTKGTYTTEDDQLWIDMATFLPIRWVLRVTGQVASPPFVETDYTDFGAPITIQLPPEARQSATEGVLYQADGAGGFEAWTHTADWQVVNGMLINDGSAIGSLTVPYQPTVTDYAVEVEVEVHSPGQPLAGQAHADFGLYVRANDAGGYGAGAQWDSGGLLGARIWDGPEVLAQGAFDPGTDWHTYRLEVAGTGIQLLVDGTLVLETTDDRQTAPGTVGLWSSGVPLTVRSFKVIALPSR